MPGMIRSRRFRRKVGERLKPGGSDSFRNRFASSVFRKGYLTPSLKSLSGFVLWRVINLQPWSKDSFFFYADTGITCRGPFGAESSDTHSIMVLYVKIAQITFLHGIITTRRRHPSKIWGHFVQKDCFCFPFIDLHVSTLKHFQSSLAFGNIFYFIWETTTASWEKDNFVLVTTACTAICDSQHGWHEPARRSIMLLSSYVMLAGARHSRQSPTLHISSIDWPLAELQLSTG